MFFLPINVIIFFQHFDQIKVITDELSKNVITHFHLRNEYFCLFFQL